MEKACCVWCTQKCVARSRSLLSNGFSQVWGVLELTRRDIPGICSSITRFETLRDGVSQWDWSWISHDGSFNYRLWFENWDAVLPREEKSAWVLFVRHKKPFYFWKFLLNEVYSIPYEILPSKWMIHESATLESVLQNNSWFGRCNACKTWTINLTCNAQEESSGPGFKGATFVLKQTNWIIECSMILIHTNAERASRKASENPCTWMCFFFFDSQSEKGSFQSNLSDQRLWSNTSACILNHRRYKSERIKDTCYVRKDCAFSDTGRCF